MVPIALARDGVTVTPEGVAVGHAAPGRSATMLGRSEIDARLTRACHPARERGLVHAMLAAASVPRPERCALLDYAARDLIPAVERTEGRRSGRRPGLELPDCRTSLGPVLCALGMPAGYRVQGDRVYPLGVPDPVAIPLERFTTRLRAVLDRARAVCRRRVAEAVHAQFAGADLDARALYEGPDLSVWFEEDDRLTLRRRVGEFTLRFGTTVRQFPAVELRLSLDIVAGLVTARGHVYVHPIIRHPYVSERAGRICLAGWRPAGTGPTRRALALVERAEEALVIPLSAGGSGGYRQLAQCP